MYVYTLLETQQAQARNIKTKHRFWGWKTVMHKSRRKFVFVLHRVAVGRSRRRILCVVQGVAMCCSGEKQEENQYVCCRALLCVEMGRSMRRKIQWYCGL